MQSIHKTFEYTLFFYLNGKTKYIKIFFTLEPAKYFTAPYLFLNVNIFRSLSGIRKVVLFAFLEWKSFKLSGRKLSGILSKKAKRDPTTESEMCI